MAFMTSFFSIVPLLLASYRANRGSPALTGVGMGCYEGA